MSKRRDFLRITGLAGMAGMIPFTRIIAGTPLDSVKTASGCALIPSETAGPFPLDLSANTFYFRQDVRESKPGVQLNLRIRVVGLNNCGPMPNLRVNIWHCDKDGLYSGYDQTNNPGQALLTYLRGYQITDADGEVEFVTIFPGWYTGRICHIHFQVYVSSSYAAISQLTFPIPEKNAIYAAYPAIYTKGADPLTYAGDNIFSDGYLLQLASLTPNITTGGYNSFLEVTVQGTGVTSGLGHLEKENAKQMTLGQNYPNPYKESTTIPFSLKFPSDVSIDLYDLAGKKVYSYKLDGLSAGDHTMPVNLKEIGLAHANYVYQMQIKNNNGIFTEYKLMTAAK